MTDPHGSTRDSLVKAKQMSGYISRYFNVQGGLNLFHGGAVNSDAVDFTFIHVINNVVIRH